MKRRILVLILVWLALIALAYLDEGGNTYAPTNTVEDYYQNYLPFPYGSVYN